MSTDPGGFYGGPVAPAPEPWAVSAVPGPRTAGEALPQIKGPVAAKRGSLHRTRMIGGVIAAIILAAVVGASLWLQGLGASGASSTATNSIKKALTAVVQVDLSNAATAEEATLAAQGTYAQNVAQLTANGFVASERDTLRVLSGTASHYCIAVTSAGETTNPSSTLYLSSDSDTPTGTPCR